MRVVEAGTVKMVWPRQFRCDYCEALLEVDLTDIGRNADYTGDFTSYFVNCPCCSEQPDVPESWWATITRMRREIFNV